MCAINTETTLHFILMLADGNKMGFYEWSFAKDNWCLIDPLAHADFVNYITVADTIYFWS